MISILRLGWALGKTFFWGARTCNCFIFGLRSFGSMFLLNSFFASPPPSPLVAAWAKFGFRASQRVCVWRPLPPWAWLLFFKNCFNFASSPPFNFSFPLFQFFDGLLVEWWPIVILGNFSFNFHVHVQSFHRWTFSHGFWESLGCFLP